MSRYPRKLLTTAAVAAWLSACGPQVDAENAPVTVDGMGPVTASRVTSDTDAVVQTSSFRTVLYSERDVEVTARMRGVVRAQLAELGDAVAQGAILAMLEDERETASLHSAQAALELARNERIRAIQLRKSEMITQAELDGAVYREKAADAAVRDALVRLGYTRVRAPFAGSVTQRMVRAGQTVNEGDPLFRVTAPRPLRAMLRLPELEARGLAIGQALSLHADDGSAIQTRVARISPAVDPASGTIEVLLDVPAPASLRPGSTVTLELSRTAVKASQ